MSGELLDRTRKQANRGVIDLEHPDAYLPWVQNRECSKGLGRRHIFPDLKYPNRAIHVMSDLELRVYYLLRENPNVQELFEQVSLEIERTSRICEELGVLHPRKPFLGDDIVMTTDFVAYIKEGQRNVFQAFAVKPEKELEKQRVLEKLFVEQLYWQEKEIRWSVITEAVFR